MKYEIIASGSSGNAILLENGLLLDCGISLKKLEPFIYKIKAIFISHSHRDHMNISTLLKIQYLRPAVRFIAGDFLENELLSSGIKKDSLDAIRANQVYRYNLWNICAFPLIHDVKNYGLKIADNKYLEKIFYAVDTKSINHVHAHDYSLYLIEANFDENKMQKNIENDLLKSGFSYRIRASKNHLSIQNASRWILEQAGNNSEYAFIHKSSTNF